MLLVNFIGWLHIWTLRNTTTSFMILWFSWPVLCYLLDVLFPPWGLLLLLLIILYFFLDEDCSVSLVFLVSSVFFPFSLNYILFEIRKLELHAAFKNRRKMFSAFGCLYVFLYWFLNVSELSVWHFLALMFSPNCTQYSPAIFSTSFSGLHYMCI